MMQRQQRLHEIVPNRIFWYWPIVLLRLFNDVRKVASTAIFHENVEYSSIAVYVAIVIAYNVLMVEVLEDITTDAWTFIKDFTSIARCTYTSATICFLSRSLMRSKLSSFRANI